GTWCDLGVAIYQFLDSINISWSAINPICFAEVEGEPSLLHFWFGVKPGTLLLEDTKKVVEGCKRILTNFPDIKVTFRESVYTQSTGLQLLEHVPIIDSTANVQGSFTPTLGLKIAPNALYFHKENGSNEVLVLTNCHITLPPLVFPINTLYQHANRSMPAHNIVLLSTQAYEGTLRAILAKIGEQLISIDIWEGKLMRLGVAVVGEASQKTKAHKSFQDLVEKVKEIITELNAFHSEVTKHWSTTDQCVLGCILYAPPISVSTGPQRFTEDWAMLSIYCDKINWDEFQGNVIDLARISYSEFILKMHPHPKGCNLCMFPPGGLLQVKGFILEGEICQPQQCDGHGKECIIVLKNSNTMGVTFSHGTGLGSFICTYPEYGIAETSMEFAVYPYGNKEGSFSAPGDSGSIIVDNQGHIIGLLSSSTGMSDLTNVTYLTPYFWLEQHIKEVFPNCYLYPAIN
ncbi:hypothetical protein FRC10_003259, partial [Ceratobasidium sp. 414]